MRLEYTLLNFPAPAYPATGTSQNVRDLREKYVQVGGGAFTGSLTIEVSLNGGTDYAVSGVARTAPGVYSVPEPATHIRVAVSALLAGAPTVHVGGYNARVAE